MANFFKPGDRLIYIGPPRREFGQNPKDHPSYYMNYVVAEMSPKNEERKHINPDVDWVRTVCVEREHPEVHCTGWKALSPKEWQVVTC